MSWAWASCYAVATLWNGFLLGAFAWQIMTTGNLFVDASPAKTLPTSEALVFLIGLGCSLACTLHQLCPRRAGRPSSGSR